MNLYFLDTSIFVRFLTGDDATKAKACKSLFHDIENEKIEATTSAMHIAEVCYVLESKITGYGVFRSDIAEGLITILSFKNIIFAEKEICIKALQIYAQSRSLDFADSYAIAKIRIDGFNKIYSYDKDFDQFKDIVRIEPILSSSSL